MKKERIEWADSLKGFVMLSVVLGHIANGLNKANIFHENSNLLFIIQNVVDTYQMPVFAIISGFLFEKAYWSEGVLDHKRFSRQVINNIIVYFIWDALFCVTKLCFSTQTNNSIELTDLFLLPLKAVGPFWYLYVLVEFYIFFGNKHIHNLKKRFAIPLFVICGFLGSWFRLFEVRWLEFVSFLFYVGFFYLGICIARYGEKKLIKWKWVAISGVLSIVLTVVNWDIDKEIYYMPIISFAVAFGFSLILLYIFTKINKLAVLGFIGRHSIEIYTFHIFITAGGRIIIKKLEIANVGVGIMLLMGLAIVLPLLLAFVMKKMKIYNIFYKPVMYIPQKQIGDNLK